VRACIYVCAGGSVKQIKMETPNKLQSINNSLYRALVKLVTGCKNNDPESNFELSEKDYGYINDDMDEIEVNYLGKAPDGDNQIRLFDERTATGAPMMTDKEAYDLMLSRINNTDIIVLTMQ
jgi:hypothetical protein